MCTQPVRIKNPKIDFNVNCDKQFIFVPCGHCEECKHDKVASFQIRAYYEYKHCIDSGGSVYYYTLTYSNDSVPTIELVNRLNRVNYRFPCFSKSHIDNFKRNFKRCLERRGFVGDFKMLITSEYGGNTRRPHYHLLVFFYGNITSHSVAEIFKNSWIEKTTNFHFRSLGFVAPGNNLGLVDSPAAIQYVSKYIAKSDSYDDISQKIRKAYLTTQYYYDYCRIPVVRGVVPKDEIWESIVNSFTPFVSKSRLFGYCAKDYMSPLQKKYGTIKMESPKDGFVSVPLPLYLLRKLYYNTVRNEKGNICYILNEDGVKRKLALLDRVIDSKIQTTMSYFCLGVVPKDLKSAFDFYTGFDLPTFHDVSNYILSVLKGRSLEQLFVYDLIYRGRSYISFSLLNYRSDYEDFLSLDAPQMPTSYTSQLLYDGLDCFNGFDHCLFILKLIGTYFSYQRYLSSFENHLKRSRALLHLECNEDKIKTKFHPPKTLVQYSKLFNYASIQQTDDYGNFF